MKNLLSANKLISYLIILTLAVHWKAPVTVFKLIGQFNNAAFLNFRTEILYFIISMVLFEIFNLTAAIGWYFSKKWRFNITYLAIIISSVVGCSYLPLTYQTFYKYFLSQPSIIPMVMINTIFLFYVIYLDISERKAKK